jgi:hypothetical protein
MYLLVQNIPIEFVGVCITCGRTKFNMPRYISSLLTAIKQKLENKICTVVILLFQNIQKHSVLLKRINAPNLGSGIKSSVNISATE